MRKQLFFTVKRMKNLGAFINYYFIFSGTLYNKVKILNNFIKKVKREHSLIFKQISSVKYKRNISFHWLLLEQTKILLIIK